MVKNVELKVTEAVPQDVGRGIVRLDPLVNNELEISVGDVVLIQGNRKTAAKVWPSAAKDSGSKAIMMDGVIRKNADVAIDEFVKVSKVDVKGAKKVNFAPFEEIRIMGGEEYLSQFLEGRVLTKGDVITVNAMGHSIDLMVTGFSPNAEAVLVDTKTRVHISQKPAKGMTGDLKMVAYEDIGGLDEEIKKIREMVELPMRHPELFEKVGVEPPKGVLLHGPPGTGKTLLARAVASETNSNFLSLSGPEIMSKYYGQSEENLRDIFKQAQENAPSIIFIDELDSIAPKRDEVKGELEGRVVAQLLALMDGLESRGKLVVIAATNRPNALDPALRRPGRFDREIEIGIPNQVARLEILKIHTRGMPLAKNVNIKKLASLSHGYAGADIEALAKEAAMKAIRRVLPNIITKDEDITVEELNKIEILKKDFEDALLEMSPSTLREVLIDIPDVGWKDVGGLESAKKELGETIEWPLKYPNLYDHMGLDQATGIMLYGPPGCGKTLIAKAVAKEANANFISIKGPELMSKWVGESEKGVREIFRKARLAAPAIIFFDEIDSLTPTRGGSCDSNVTERVISQILTEMDGLEKLKGVIVIGATNRLDMIDKALLRPGRFDKIVFIPNPTRGEREEILKVHTKKMPMSKNVNVKELAKETDGFTGAEIEAVCKTASMNAIRRYVDKGNRDKDEEKVKRHKVDKKDFKEALKKIKDHREKSLAHPSSLNSCTSGCEIPPLKGMDEDDAMVA
jgi:transitional endoplasmic reticulum ATPase